MERAMNPQLQLLLLPLLLPHHRRPAGYVHPRSLALLAREGLPTAGYASKSWDQLPARPDLVITVCGSAAGETCPAYLAPVPRAHWGVDDPAGASGSLLRVQSAPRLLRRDTNVDQQGHALAASAGVFVSYRRDDTRHVAGRLAGDLADHFGTDSIFRDVESIDGGEEFPVRLEKALAQCAVMLVLIGHDWLAAKDAQGRRRLDDPADWVRQEIVAALRRAVRVVPVLVEGAALPAEADLPDELKPLVKRQARPLADERWRGDLAALMEMLSKQTGLATSAPVSATARAATAARPSRVVPVAGAVLAVVAVGAFAWMQMTSIPDVSGTWRAKNGEHYVFEQNGREITIQTRMGEEVLGSGSGQLRDGRLGLRFSTRQGEGEWIENCELVAESDIRFAGTCRPVNLVDADGKPVPAYDYAIFR